MDETLTETWPDGFGMLGGLSFEKAYQSEKKFVDITLDGMSEATGIFKRWYEFCHQKSKHGQTTKISNAKSASGD